MVKGKATKGEKSGSITHMVSEDIWNYEKAPEGWPTATMATCHYTMLREAGQKAPSSINAVCEAALIDEGACCPASISMV